LILWRIPVEYIRYHHFFLPLFHNNILQETYLIACALSAEWLGSSLAVYYFVFILENLGHERNVQCLQLLIDRKKIKSVQSLMNQSDKAFETIERLLNPFPLLWVSCSFLVLSADIMSFKIMWKRLQERPIFLTGYSVLYYILILSVFVTVMSNKRDYLVKKYNNIQTEVSKAKCIPFCQKIFIIQHIREKINEQWLTGWSCFYLRKMYLPMFFSVTFSYTILFIQMIDRLQKNH
jgi:hypothetical protein